MGEMLGAKYQIKSSVTKTGTSYSFHVDFQDLKTGQYLAEYNKSASTFEKLYQSPGSALNEAVIEICDKLDAKFGTGLSPLQKGDLMGKDFSFEEEKQYLEEEEKRRRTVIADLDKEITSIKYSTATNDDIRTVQLELRRSQEQEKLKQAQQKQARLDQEAQNRLAELEKQKTRSDELKKRISATETIIKDKRELLRKQNFETSSVLALINEIEAKKKAILEIQRETDDQIKELEQKRDKELSEKKKEIMDAPLRLGEKDSKGKITSYSQRIRESKYEEEEFRIRSNYEVDIESLTKPLYIAENDLMEQIENQYKILGKLRIADNIESRDLRLIVGWRGENRAWSATAIILSDGKEICSYNFDIGYEMLSGKNPNLEGYDEYLDNVDYYNSLFSNEKAPPVWVKLAYRVIPEALDKPSLYAINLSYLELYHTETEAKIAYIGIDKSEKKQMSPRYDIWTVAERYEQEKKAATTQESIKKQAKTNSQQSTVGWEERAQQMTGNNSGSQTNNSNQKTNNSTNQSNSSSNWSNVQRKASFFDIDAKIPQYTRRGYYADIGYSFGSFYNDFDFGLDSLWPWSESEHFYWGFGFSILSAKINNDYVDQASEKFKGATLRFMEGYVCLGLSYNLSFGRPYVQGNIGYYFSLDKSEYGDDYSVGGFMFSGIIGMDFGSGIIISPYYGVKYSAGKGFEDVLGISLAIDFGW
ncbi:MAG: hypothetical protein K5930_12980 [Treponemataceae bacterium]|nr:hypothetical protein [Treponemataceae bacterium]